MKTWINFKTDKISLWDLGDDTIDAHFATDGDHDRLEINDNWSSGWLILPSDSEQKTNDNSTDLLGDSSSLLTLIWAKDQISLAILHGHFYNFNLILMSASNSFTKESMQKLNNSFFVQKQNLSTELSTVTINNKIRSSQFLTMTTDNLVKW